MGQRIEHVDRLRGRFVVFDGPDGSGKSTQFRRLADLLSQAGLTVCEVREPGGTFVGEQIRRMLLDPACKEDMDVRCEMLLFMASRAQLVANRIRPALKAGELVLADRFISSTLAYQGTAGGLPIEEIMQVGRFAVGDCWPDLTVIFDVDEQTALARMNPLLRQGEFDQPLDRMEARGAAFHRTVRQGYLKQAQDNPEGYLIVDAAQGEDQVFAELIASLDQRLARI